ncbi:MAG TPA: hypothetical protein PKD99_02430 [Sphingopyxis sp.]|nr:hypothetical protein [Sphingopyxis sp.]HMP43934.1 hypothetical protein [Sphingopyxis sp.]HMQ20029.1 hypothetical protein [Sphingopyxis sp.]
MTLSRLETQLRDALTEAQPLVETLHSLVLGRPRTERIVARALAKIRAALAAAAAAGERK